MTWQDKADSNTLDTVFKDICGRHEAPNSEQRQILETFVLRMKREKLEELVQHERQQIDSLFNMIHGHTGTGKSRVIAWLRELMQKGMGWSHGVEFVCLTFLKEAVALMDGYTIHHWAEIPVSTFNWKDSIVTGGQKQSSRCQKCQNLRVIIIDELNMVAAELFGALEYIVRNALRDNHTYKLRPDGSTRPFGGINVFMFADWQHLPPGCGTSLSTDPSKVSFGLAHDALSMLWDRGRGSVRRTWSLEQPMRCNPQGHAQLCKTRKRMLACEDLLPKDNFPSASVPNTPLS